jgi:hypothetical protein
MRVFEEEEEEEENMQSKRNNGFHKCTPILASISQ